TLASAPDPHPPMPASVKSARAGCAVPAWSRRRSDRWADTSRSACIAEAPSNRAARAEKVWRSQVENFSWIQNPIRIESAFELPHQVQAGLTDRPRQIFFLGQAHSVFAGDRAAQL